MFYRLYLIFSLTFCSALASEKPHGLFEKISVLMANVAKKISDAQIPAEEQQRAQQLVLARQAVQELDTHLSSNITNIVVASLGTGSMHISVPMLLKNYRVRTFSRNIIKWPHGYFLVILSQKHLWLHRHF